MQLCSYLKNKNQKFLQLGTLIKGPRKNFEISTLKKNIPISSVIRQNYFTYAISLYVSLRYKAIPKRIILEHITD